MSPVHLNRRREPPSLSDTRNENSCVSDMPVHTFRQSSEHTMSTFPRLRRVKEKSKVSSAAYFVQNIESLPKCDLYYSDPDAKAKEARMSYATSGNEIKPSFSQLYSVSYQDCISADKRSISSQLLLLDDKDEVFRKIDNNEEHIKENIGFLASNKSPETSQSHFAQSHSAANSFCHINHERANLQACTNEVTIKYSKKDENVKTIPDGGDTGKVKITSPRTAPSPLKSPELSKTEPTVEGLPQTPIVGAENNNFFSSDVPLEVPSEGRVHTDIFEETLEAQGDSVNQLTNRPNTRLLPHDRHVGSAQALSGKSREKIDHRLSRRTQIEPLGPVHRLRRSLSRSRRKAVLQTTDDVPSATVKKTIGCRIKNVGRKATKQPVPDDTKDTNSKFFGFSRNRRALVSEYSRSF
jgi:hypothetical protein